MVIKMKVLILLCMVFITAPLMADSNESKDVVQAKNDNAFKGLLYKVWNKFKSMSPKNETVVRETTVTMGVRGAQTTSTILQPYWKDDKTSDKQFMQQLEDFAQAQGLADKGEMEAANSAFNGFIKKYPQSDLKPNAQFAEALTMGVLGKVTQSGDSFKQFIEENPEHPLVVDARQVMRELGVP
jgi:TolA-binding protein